MAHVHNQGYKLYNVESALTMKTQGL